jgi:hypothetical protein
MWHCKRFSLIYKKYNSGPSSTLRTVTVDEDCDNKHRNLYQNGISLFYRPLPFLSVDVL